MDANCSEKKTNDVTLSATVRVEGGTADQGKLKLHDAQSMLRGFTSLVNQIVHSFLNDGEIKRRVNNTKGAETYISAPKKGCFEETIEIVFQEDALSKITSNPQDIKKIFWDYFNWCVRHSLGEDYTPKSALVRKIDKNDNNFIINISESIEEYLKYIHKVVDTDNTMTIDLIRPNFGRIIRFDKSTFDYVTDSTKIEETEVITGNITRFNVNTGNGRLYSDQEYKIISFSLDKSNQSNISQFIVQSMEEKVSGGEGKFTIIVSKMLTPSGAVKKYFIHNMNK